MDVAQFVTIPAAWRETTDYHGGRVTVSVSVSRFLIGVTPVTQGQYREIVGDDPSHYPGDERPVERVSWWDAVSYCNARSEAEGLLPCYDLDTGACDFAREGYRLPTSMEWSVAAAGADECAEPSAGNLGRVDTKNGVALLRDLRDRGTCEVGAHPANSHGLHDMLGNVWEWCNDWYADTHEQGLAAADRGEVILPSVHDPTGPRWGHERVIRGGCFLSTPYTYREHSGRRCLRPDRRSMFTGFRVVRRDPSRDEDLPAQPSRDSSWIGSFSRVPEGKDGRGDLGSLLIDEKGNRIGDVQAWERRRTMIRARWLERLGVPPDPDARPAVAEIRRFNEEAYVGTLEFLDWADGVWIKLFVMRPRKPVRIPTPAVIVNWYDVDTPAGRDLGGYHVHEEAKLKRFGYLMAQQGLIAVAVQWWDLTEEGYEESMARLVTAHPSTVGLGRTVWDTARVVDYLETLEDVDSERIGIIGHCMGGITTIYAGALEERIAAVVACGSNCSVSNRDSNYDDYWYLGAQVAAAIDPSTDQQELLALTAPRPFLLALGKGNFIDPCFPFVEAAREVYELYGSRENLGYVYDYDEKPPSTRNVGLMRDWLVHQLLAQEGDGNARKGGT